MPELVDLAKDYQTAISERDSLMGQLDAAQAKVHTIGAQMLSEVGKTEKNSPARRMPSTVRSNGHAVEIRAWAKKNKMECPDRGRIPNKVIEAYNASHKA